jgi:peptidoglycan L-alanyl-D-glutamate endopeptidase CwlK
MDKITIDRIELAHPKIREELKQQYIEANNLLGKGARLRFVWVYRTNAEQNALFNKRPKVTNAKGGQSMHNYGLAFDIVLLYDNDGDGKFEEASWSMTRDFDKDGKADWQAIVSYFKSKGWEWGGDWNSFKDAPHFQKAFGHTWRTLEAKVKNGEVVLNNNVKYPKF